MRESERKKKNTLNITNMGLMFYDIQNLTEINLSSFYMSNVSNTNGMFANTGATTGYAKTQADTDKFNSSGGIPSTLTFTFK